MSMNASAQEMICLFKQGDVDGDGRIDCDEFIALGTDLVHAHPIPCQTSARTSIHAPTGEKVDVFATSAAAFSSKPSKAGSIKKRQSSRVLVRKGSRLGPLLETDTSSLSFETRIATPVEKYVIMVNTGSTALYYTWRRERLHLGLATASAADTATHVYVPNGKGCILPGASRRVCFLFVPSKVGIFTERWVLSANPQPRQPPAPVVVRGVCTEVPETQQQTHGFAFSIAKRHSWHTARDILLRDVLASVFDVSSLMTVAQIKEARSHVRPEPATSPASGPTSKTILQKAAWAAPTSETTMQKAAWASFQACFARRQRLAVSIACSTFDVLCSLWSAVLDSGSQWGGEITSLEDKLDIMTFPFTSGASSADDEIPSRAEALASLEATLQGAAVATPDVSRGLRLKQTAAACCALVLFELADAADETEGLNGKLSAPLVMTNGTGLVTRGVPVTWCWETQRYERSDGVADIGAAAREMRLANERQAASAAAWEAKKLAMSKRERKKVEEKERKEAVAVAVETSAKEAAAAQTMATETAVEAAAPDLAATTHRAQLVAAVRGTIKARFDAFVWQASALEAEASP